MIIDGHQYSLMPLQGRWRAQCGAFVAYGETRLMALANCRAKMEAMS